MIQHLIFDGWLGVVVFYAVATTALVGLGVGLYNIWAFVILEYLITYAMKITGYYAFFIRVLLNYGKVKELLDEQDNSNKG